MSLKKSATAAPPADSANQPDFWSVLSARAGRKPGRLYKRGQNAFLDGPADKASVDKSAMSATFCISRPIPDREDDLIVPEGVIFDDYRLNPVVFWDHGFTSLTLPIGTSESPGGDLAISVSPEGIDATCFFSQTLLEAEQIFELVDEGIIRAASIHVDPIDAVVRVRNGAADRPGLLVHTSNMLEWSLCGVGCNPEAVRKALSGKIAGKPVSESLAKSLRAHAAPAPAMVGWTPELSQPATEPQPMAKSLQKDDEKPEEAVKRLRKELDDMTGDDEETKSKRKSLEDQIKSLTKSDGGIPDEPGEYPERHAEPDGDEAPLGSQILGAAYSALSEVADRLEQSSKMLENPEVKDYIGSMTGALRGHMGEMDDLHKSEYPDHPELSKEDPEDDPSKDDANDGLTKFLSRSKTHRLGVRGIGHELLKLSASRYMPKGFRDKLNQMSRQLAKISKSAEQGAATALSSDQIAEMAVVKKELAELKAVLKDAIPHRQI